MIAKRYLIVNADDFGLSPGVNQGIIEAYERGVVTSASLMVRWPHAADAAAYGRQHPRLSLGLHIDLGEWLFHDSNWEPCYEVVPMHDVKAVADEVSHQLAEFRRLVKKDPTHIDSHQHVHLREPAHSVVREMAQELGVPLRRCSPNVRYCGDFYGQTTEGSSIPGLISVDGLTKILEGLSSGFTELGCHPGQGHDLHTMYRYEREQEVKVLCDARVWTALSAMQIELCSFHKFSPPFFHRRASAKSPSA